MFEQNFIVIPFNKLQTMQSTSTSDLKTAALVSQM